MRKGSERDGGKRGIKGLLWTFALRPSNPKDVQLRCKPNQMFPFKWISNEVFFLPYCIEMEK